MSFAVLLQTWFFCFLPVLGLWVIGLHTPALRHVWWHFAALGEGGRKDEQPMWDRQEFETRLAMIPGELGWMAHSLWTCTGCQSYYVGCMTGLVFTFAAGLSLLWLVPSMLGSVPLALVTLRIINKI